MAEGTTDSVKTDAEVEAEDYAKRIVAALDIAENGGVDGADHKMWVIDQMVHALTGEDYAQWVSEYEDGEDGPETYEWDTGIAP